MKLHFYDVSVGFFVIFFYKFSGDVGVGYLWLQSILFDQFVIQAGADASGVATAMVSMNSTVKLTFRNTATFFGVHVTSTPLDLTYSQLKVASGTVRMQSQDMFFSCPLFYDSFYFFSWTFCLILWLSGFKIFR